MFPMALYVDLRWFACEYICTSIHTVNPPNMVACINATPKHGSVLSCRAGSGALLHPQGAGHGARVSSLSRRRVNGRGKRCCYRTQLLIHQASSLVLWLLYMIFGRGSHAPAYCSRSARRKSKGHACARQFKCVDRRCVCYQSNR